MSFKAIRENKILAKISEFTVSISYREMTSSQAKGTNSISFLT